MNDSTKIKLNDQIADTIMSVVKTSLTKADYISAIERKLRNEIKDELDEANSRAAFIDLLIADIALMYEIRYQPGLPFDNMVDELDLFKKTLIARIKSGAKPKQKILQFSVNDEGDTDIYNVTKKSTEYAAAVFGSHRYDAGLSIREVAFDYTEKDALTRPLYRHLQAHTGWDYTQITDWRTSRITNQMLIDAIAETLTGLIKSNSVSLNEFAECIHDLVVTDDGSTCQWITL